MRALRWAIALVLVSASLASGQDSSATGRVTALADSASSADRETEANLRRLSQQMTALDSSLRRGSTTANEQRLLLNALAQRLLLLESYGSERYKGRVVQTHFRYNAGTQVLDDVIDQLAGINFATTFGTAVGSLGDLGNPRTFEPFASVISDVTQALDGRQEGLKDAGGFLGSATAYSAGSLASFHPVVAGAFAISALFNSKLSQSKKASAAPRVACALRYSSQAYETAVSVGSDMRSLQLRVSRMLADAESYMTTHLSIIGFAATYDEYLRDKSQPSNLYSRRLRSFEVRLLADTSNRRITALGETPDDIVRTEYSLRQIGAIVDRYEQLLHDITLLFDRMEFVPSQLTLVSCAGLGDISDRTAKLKEDLRNAREAFDRAYLRRVISAEERRALFGI